MNRLISFVLICVLFSGSIVYGAAITWSGSTTNKSDWNTASNWTPAQVPASTDAVTLSSTGGKYTGNITLDADGSITMQEVNDASSNYFTNFYGDFTMTGGTATFNGKRVLAGFAGNDVTWNISGGKFTYKHDVGSKNGSFRFGVNWDIADATAAARAAAQTLNISGANTEFHADRLVLGYNGSLPALSYKQTVNMNVSGGAAVTLGPNAGNEISYMGRASNMDATMTLSDSSTLTGGGAFTVGKDGGKGTLLLKDTSIFKLTSGNLTIGENSTEDNKVTVSGNASLQITNGINVASGNAKGTLEVTGGTVKAGWISLNNGGKATLSGGTSTISTLTINSGGVVNVTDAANLTYTTLTQNPNGTLNLNLGPTGSLSAFPTDTSGFTNINGGTYTSSADLHIKNTNNVYDAILTVNAGSLSTTRQIMIGFNNENSHGQLVVNGGTVSAQYLQIANTTNTSGEIKLTGGMLTSTEGVRIGRNGTGILTITGGTLKVGTAGTTEKSLFLGYEGTTSNGTLNMTGGTIDTTTKGGSIFIGRQGTGNAVISQKSEANPTLIKTDQLQLASQEGSSGSWKQTGGTLTITNTFQVGQGGNGTVDLKDTTVRATDLYIGSKTNNTSGTGKVTAENSTLTLSNNIYVGAIGTGELSLTNCETSTLYLCLGWNANSVNSVATIKGGTTNVNANLRIGLNAPATMNVLGNAAITATNASFNASSNLNFLMQDGTFGTLTINNILAEGLKGMVTADFGGGLQFTSGDSWTLVNQTGSMQLQDSDYFTVSQSGSNTVANLRTDVLPSDGASRGIALVEDSPTEMAFYTGLWNDDPQLNEFVDWLNRTNGKLNATVIDRMLGSVSITVPDGVTSMLWDFTNSGTDAIYSTNPAVPEPSTWALLLIGLLALKWRKK